MTEENESHEEESKDNLESFSPPQELSELLNSGDLKKIRETKTEDYPRALPLIALTKQCYMPGMTVPLFIEPGPYYELLKEVSKMENKFLGLILSKKEEQDIYDVTQKDLYNVGVVARILRILTISEGAGAQVILNVERRFKVEKVVSKPSRKYLVANVKYHKEGILKGKKEIITAYASNLIKTIREILTLNPIFKEELSIILNHSDFAQPWKICDFAVALTTATREEKQDILATFDLEKRMEKAAVLLQKELDISKLQAMINQKIEATVSKSQREYFLREQLKAIQKELGMAKDDKTVDLEKFKERGEQLEFSPEAKKVFDDEMDKLRVLDIQSAEYAVVRGYIDWLTCLPWGIYDEENSNLSKAEKILEADHYGLKDVKERILEYISVGVLKHGTKGYILCLVGPPGVGKTSIGKSIARALNRPFFRFSLGGMRDESEIKGHRRTYVGAMPGKLIQALKSTQVKNPVIMLDEIDKIGMSFQGDPASALLEVLDPEQNKDFLDHYLDVRFDLSDILFITTANTTDTIPSALKDRMEVIRLSGYIEEEKMKIATKYLIPKNRNAVGLKTSDFIFRANGLHKVIREYCREAGVRQLEKAINKVMRKVAMEKVKNQEEKGRRTKKVEVTEKTVEKYLGKPIFHPERFYGTEQINGVATGLAWTELGGALLYIEAVKHKGKERLQLTGNAGDVMKESANIAMTYLFSEKNLYLPNLSDDFNEEIHMHIPEGATPKDGPSAGVTLTTALISLLSGKPVPSDLAMTGEITLKGRVLGIGGLKEKLLAARREKINHIIVPKDNKRDYDELPLYLKKGITMHFVDNYKQIYEIVFNPKKKSARRKTK